ncbi:MAG: glycosyltransferase family 39 protein [Planctomycetota bacterium]
MASFLFALALYVGLRFWILATAFDAVAIPVYEIATIGSYSWTLSGGVPLLPWADHYDNAGAQILTSWLAALSYGLFGASYLALKLVPLTFGVVLLALVGRLLARFVSGRAALLGMLSVAVAPPIVTKYSMLAKGNHFEGLTLLFLALLLALEVPRDSPRRRAWVVGTGFALGFAISMYFGAILTAAVLSVAWLIRFGFGRSLRDLPWFGGGFAMGLVPFVVLNVATQGRASAFGAELGSPTVDAPLEGVLAKAHSLLVTTLPEGACFVPALGLPATHAEWVFLGLTVLAWVVVAIQSFATLRGGGADGDPATTNRVRDRRAALFVLLAYPMGVLVVLSLKGLPIMPKSPPVEILGVRYLLGYYFFALLLIAVATDGLFRHRALFLRLVGGAATLALLFTWPFTAAIATPHWEARHDSLRYPGVHLRQYAILFHWDVREGKDGEFDTSRLKACLDRLSDAGQEDQRSELAIGIGAFLSLVEGGYQSRAREGEDAFRLASVTRDFDERDHADLLRGVGAYFQSSARSHALRPRGKKPAPLRQQIDAVLRNEDAAPLIAEGFGMFQQYPLLRRIAGEVNRSMNLLAILPEELRPHTLRGMARTLQHYRELGLGLADGAIERQLKRLSPADQSVVRDLLAGS